MTNLKDRMISKMFALIKRGPACDDMIIHLKNSNVEIRAFHWHGHSHLYNIVRLERNEKGACINHKLIAEDFKSWSDAFNWLADYILKEVN